MGAKVGHPTRNSVSTLKVLESRELRKMLLRKMDQVRTGWRKIRNTDVSLFVIFSSNNLGG